MVVVYKIKRKHLSFYDTEIKLQYLTILSSIEEGSYQQNKMNASILFQSKIHKFKSPWSLLDCIFFPFSGHPISR